MSRTSVVGSRVAPRCASVEPLENRLLCAAVPHDTTFGGGDGRVNIANAGEGLSAVMDGFGVVVAGRYRKPGTADDDFGIVAYTRDGALDTRFGAGGADGDGVVTFDFGSPDERATKIVHVPNGAGFFVGGPVGGGRAALLRVDGNGALNPFFGDGGVLFMDEGLLRDFAVTDDGWVVTAGTGSVNGRPGWVVQRLSQFNGSFDPAFGNDGVVVTGFAGRAAAAFVDGTSVAGYADGGRITFARYTQGGTLDPSFGPDGLDGTGGISTLSDAANGVLTQIGGGVTAAGSVRGPSGSADFLLVNQFNGRPDSLATSTVINFETLSDGADTDDTVRRVLQLPDSSLLVLGDVTLPPAAAAANPDVPAERQVLFKFGPGGRDRSTEIVWPSAGVTDVLIQPTTQRVLLAGGPGLAVESLANRADGSPVNAAPSATLGGPPIVVPGAREITFVVSYTDDFGIDPNTIDAADVRITGPRGFNTLATPIDVKPDTGFNGYYVTYRFAAPEGGFVAAANGTYTVSVEPDQVRDAGGRPVPQGPFSNGTFIVDAPSVGPNLVTEAVRFASKAPLIPGGKSGAKVLLRVRNAGNQLFAGRLNLALTAVPGLPATAKDGYFLRSPDVSARIRPGAVKRFTVAIRRVPEAMPPGEYTLVAWVHGNSDVHETNDDDNVGYAPTPLLAVAPRRSRRAASLPTRRRCPSRHWCPE